jgi:hypothetical protein
MILPTASIHLVPMVILKLREPKDKKKVAKENCIQSSPSYFPGTKSEFLTPKTSDVLTLL